MTVVLLFKFVLEGDSFLITRGNTLFQQRSTSQLQNTGLKDLEADNNSNEARIFSYYKYTVQKNKTVPIDDHWICSKGLSESQRPEWK